MKKLLFACCIVTVVSLSCSGQNAKVKSLNVDTLQKDKYLKNTSLLVYQSVCMNMLLASIVESNYQNYPESKYFYSLTFIKVGKNRRINIQPMLWSESKDMDYKGIIKYSNASYLLKGNFESDFIFKRSAGINIEVSISQKKDTFNNIPFIHEPVLQGFFLDCKGVPVYIEVYTDSRISKFKMSEEKGVLIIRKAY